MKNKKIIIFTGPSGVGKATIEREIFKNEELKLSLSISATTRPPRNGEVDGKHYHFITNEEFDKKVENDEFIEYNSHFSNKYGTLTSEIERIHGEGKVAFLEVETEGAKKIINKLDRANIVSIFIAPPSIQKLRHRITERGSETIQQIEERLSRVEQEMEEKSNFDYVVYNDVLDHTIDQVTHIIKKELH